VLVVVGESIVEETCRAARLIPRGISEAPIPTSARNRRVRVASVLCGQRSPGSHRQNHQDDTRRY
jgi:hypothetical protein